MLERAVPDASAQMPHMGTARPRSLWRRTHN